jgi:hypothetical protein
LTAPQVVLFQRNARYYPILVLFYALLVWHLDYGFQSRRMRWTVAALILAALFHTHPFTAACSCVSLLAFCWCFRRAAFAGYALAAFIGFSSWLVWYELLGSPLAETHFAMFAVPAEFSSWLRLFAGGTWAALADLDATDSFPILLWLALLGGLLWRGRKAVMAVLREPLVSFVFGNILIQAIAAAAVFRLEFDGHSPLRYMPHLLVFALISAFVALDARSLSGNRHFPKRCPPRGWPPFTRKYSGRAKARGMPSWRSCTASPAISIRRIGTRQSSAGRVGRPSRSYFTSATAIWSPP